MQDLAIRVEGISKRYRIGAPSERNVSLPEAVARALTPPWMRKDRVQTAQAEEFWALRDVSFDVARGQVLGVIGRNGAGKSTLLKVLSRITEPTDGQVEINGRIASLLEVGTGFHPELTGRENVYLNGAILGMGRAEIQRKFDEIVAFAEVEKFLDTPVKRYSSGMYLRLAFAVAAHLEPEILVVDEVLAVGDSGFQKKCIGRMGDISRQGRTVLLVSHNLPSIITLCDRALRLDQGKVVAYGPAGDVVEQYLTSNSSTGGAIVWNDPSRAPGDETARLHAVRVFQDGVNGPTADVDISKEVEIHISYWNMVDGQELYTALWLRDHMGTPVLSTGNSPSISLTSDPWFGRPQPAGLYHSVVRIPGNFLNDGMYSIAAIVGRVPNTTILNEDYALSFRVQDTGEMRKEYLGTWIGTVRPKLAWCTARDDRSSLASAN